MVDTIRAHIEVCLEKGSVWWGWWKKRTEPDHTEELEWLKRSVTNERPLAVWLIDTSAEKLHLATVIEVRTRLPETDAPLVPQYYRNSIGEIPGWFRLSKIETDAPYDPKLERAIGQSTFRLDLPVPGIQRDGR